MLLLFIIFGSFMSLAVSLWASWSGILFRFNQIVSNILISLVFHFSLNVFTVTCTLLPCSQPIPQKSPMVSLGVSSLLGNFCHILTKETLSPNLFKSQGFFPWSQFWIIQLERSDMPVPAQNSGAYKKYVEIPWSGGEE